MRAKSIVVTVVLTGLVALLVKGTYKPVTPQEESGSFVDGTPAPETIAEMKEQADAVVLGTYLGHRRTIFDNRAGSVPFSLYTFEIREVFKAHPALERKRSFSLELIGGVVVGRAELVSGHRYVIFARRWGRWVPASGQDGGGESIYDISTGGAVSLSTEEWNNTSPSSSRAFIDELRRH